MLALLVFGVFAARYADDDSAGRLDRRVQSLIGASDRGLPLPGAVIILGNPATVVVLAVLLACVALTLGHRRLAALAIVGPGVAGVATTTLKPVIGRTLDGAVAFPSGHTGGATAIGVVAALLLISMLRTATGTSALLLSAGALVSGGVMALAHPRRPLPRPAVLPAELTITETVMATDVARRSTSESSGMSPARRRTGMRTPAATR